MKSISIILLLSTACLLIPQAHSFSCQDIKYQSYCDSADGCIWEEEDCSGSLYPPPCLSGWSCVYVDSNSSTDGNGNIDTPFNSLDSALELLTDSYMIQVFIINLPDSSPTQLPQDQVSIPDYKGLTLQSFFSLGKQKLDCSLSSTIILGASCVLQIFNAELKGGPSAALFQTNVTSLDDAQQINFENVTVELDYNGAFIVANYYNVTMTNVEVKKYQQSFASISGNWTFVNLWMHDFESYGQKTSNFNTSQVWISDSIFSNLLFTAVQQKRYLFLLRNSSCAINNVNLTNSGHNFLQSFDSQTNLTNLRFTDSFAYNFINVVSDIDNLVNLQNLTFENIVVSQSALILSSASLTLENIFIKDIVFQAAEEEEDYFDNNFNGICLYAYQILDTLSISSSIFSNISNHCIYADHVQNIIIQDSIFDNSGFVDYDYPYGQTSAAYGGATFLNIDKSPQLPNINDHYENTNPGTLFVQRTIFSHSPNLMIQKAGAINIFSDPTYKDIILKDCIFDTNWGQLGGALAIYQELDSYWEFLQLELTIDSSIFARSTSKARGGCLTIQGYSPSSSPEQNQINQSIFMECKSKTLGGAVSITNFNATFDKTQFVQNSADFGGALSLLPSESNILSSNTFVNNIARQQGAAIFYKGDNAICYNCEGQTLNYDSEGNKFSKNLTLESYRIEVYSLLISTNKFKNLDYKLYDLLTANSNYTKLENSYTHENLTHLKLNFSSGDQFTSLIKILFLDKTGNVDENIAKYGLQMSFEEDDLANVFQNNTFHIINGIGYIYQQSLIGPLNQTSTLTIGDVSQQWSIISFADLDFNMQMKIKFVECPQGDIQSELGYLCTPCQNTTYSLDDPQSITAACLDCPPNMVCLGRNTILPMPGYYRYGKNSSTALECVNDQVCLGGLIPGRSMNLSGYCAPPFTGVLCGSCEEGYAIAEDKESCIKCDFGMYFFLGMLVKVAASLGLVIFELFHKLEKVHELRESFEKENEEELQKIEAKLDFSGVTKVLITFIQMQSIVKVLNLNYVSYFKNFYGFTSKISPLITDGFSSECWFQYLEVDDQHTFYYDFIFSAVQPFIFLLFLMVGFAIKARKDSHLRFWDTTKMSAIILFYINQPEILIETLNLFKCKDLGGTYFLEDNLNIQCYTDFYYKWSYSLGIPMIIIWGFAYPISLLVRIRRGMKAPEDSEQRYQVLSDFSFVVGGYKNKYYYWEFFSVYRKVLMVLAVIMINDDVMESQGIIIMIILGISLYLNVDYDAYSNSETRSLEILSILSIMMYVQLGLYFENFNSTSDRTFQQEFTIVVLSLIGVFVTLCFFAKTAFALYKTVRRGIGKGVAAVIRKVRKSTVDVDISFSEVEMKNNSENEGL